MYLLIRRAIIIPDMQVPYHDKKSVAAVEKLMADYKFDWYINLGDFLDFDCISIFNEDKLKNLETKRILKDYEVANDILDRHQSLIRMNNKNAEFILLEGNHEYRIERLIEKMPQLEGLIEVEKCLRLKERGFQFYRWMSPKLFHIGNAFFIHGNYTNQYHAAKMVNAYGVSIYYGHTHDVQAFCKVIKGKDKTIEGHSMGCLCEYEQSYIKGNPSNWQQCVGIGEFFDDGFYNITPIRIFKHRFAYAGKVYEE